MVIYGKCDHLIAFHRLLLKATSVLSALLCLQVHHLSANSLLYSQSKPYCHVVTFTRAPTKEINAQVSTIILSSLLKNVLHCSDEAVTVIGELDSLSH